MKLIANYLAFTSGKRRFFFMLVAFLLFLTACADKKPEFRSVDITGADYAKDFALPDVNGQTKTMADFKGKAVVLFFGFAQCPDVCPTTMAEIATVKKSLGKDGDKVTAVFVTVDPERDTAQVLKAYMESFDATFTALRGTPEQTEALAKYYKIYYKKVSGKTPTSYTIDHTAASFVYDPQGKLRLYTRYGMGAQALAEDIKFLLK
jgi:protein SCO1